MAESGIQGGAGGESSRTDEPGLRKRWPANVGILERLASAAAGGALIYYGSSIRGRTWLRALLAIGGADLLLRGIAGRSLAYRAMGFSTTKASGGTIKVEKAVIVHRPAEEIHRFWRNFENLPRVMDHLRAVRSIDDRRSHWVAKGPAGMEVEWDAEITEEQEGRLIGWRSLEGTGLQTSGMVAFEPLPDGGGTEVRVNLEYLPPAGKAGQALAKLFGRDPAREIGKDLARFKQLLETGEIASGQFARG